MLWCTGRHIVLDSEKYFVYGIDKEGTDDETMLAINTKESSLGLDFLLGALPPLAPCTTDQVRELAKQATEIFKVEFDVEPLLVSLAKGKEDEAYIDDSRDDYWGDEESSSEDSY